MACVSACECDDDLPIQVCNASTKYSSMCHVITVIKRFSVKAEINNVILNCQIVSSGPKHKQKTTVMRLNALCCMSKQISWTDWFKFSSHCIGVMERRKYLCHIGY